MKRVTEALPAPDRGGVRTEARELPPGVRIGAGGVIDDDVQLGGRGRRFHVKGIEIGRGAMIRGGSTVLDGARVGDRLETGRNVLIAEDSTIGDDCRISHNTIIGSACTIGDRVEIDANCYIAQFTTIDDDVAIAPGVCLANDPHPGSRTTLCQRGPTIKRGAQIGMNATILPFVTIGERSLVGAGSVVTRDVPAGFVVVGNPARILKPVTTVSCPLDVEGGTYLQPPTKSAEPPTRGRPQTSQPITR
ncbi:MAG: acyltransferase [Candidatus Limnocylindria bacterium]